MIFLCFSAVFPDKPTNLTVISITSRSVEISWVSPKNRGYYGFSNVLIELKKDSSPILSFTTGIVNHYKIRDLSPHTTYEISVTGGNYKGFENAAIAFILTSEEGIYSKIKIKLITITITTNKIITIQIWFFYIFSLSLFRPLSIYSIFLLFCARVLKYRFKFAYF